MFVRANRRLPTDQMIAEIRERSGLIPIDLDSETGELVWLDIGNHRLSESFFFVSTEELIDREESPVLYGTELSLLEAFRETPLREVALQPSAFIFHMGRCGSTLLSKALARSDKYQVISEAPPHFLVWPHLSGGWTQDVKATEENLAIFRELTLAMGRRRRPEQRRHIVKFTTYCVLFIEFIMAAFLGVPCLFIYRDPAEVLVSFLRQGPGWEGMREGKFGKLTAGAPLKELRKMSRTAYFERCLVRFLTAALETRVPELRFLNYKQLTPDNLPTILEALGIEAGREQIALIAEQFNYYAKDDTGEAYMPDTAEKQKAVTPEIRELVARELAGLYDRLERSERNLLPEQPGNH